MTDQDTENQDLDALLAKYEQESKPEQPAPQQAEAPKPQAPAPSQPDPALQVMMQRMDQEDLSRLVKTVSGDLKAPEKLVRGFIHAEAQENPNLGKIWGNRHANQSAFNDTAKGLSAKFQKEFGSIFSKPEEKTDVEAVRAAVRDAPQNPSDEDERPDFSKMTDREYAAYKRGIFKKYGETLVHKG